MNQTMKSLKGIIVLALSCSLLLNGTAYAETVSDYMADGIRAAYHNMHLIFEAYYDEDGGLETQPAGFVAIKQEWDDNGNLISRTYLNASGEPTNRIDGYSTLKWQQGENGKWNISFYDNNGNIMPFTGLFLTGSVATVDGCWSDWMSPATNTSNSTFTLGYADLGEKTVGDVYICYVEIEFKDVQVGDPEQFSFQTQGTVDGEWKTGSIWYPNVVSLSSAPEDGFYNYASLVTLNQNQANSNVFEIGFRCDYWRSGSFRVRNVKIEKSQVNRR